MARTINIMWAFYWLGACFGYALGLGHGLGWLLFASFSLLPLFAALLLYYGSDDNEEEVLRRLKDKYD